MNEEEMKMELEMRRREVRARQAIQGARREAGPRINFVDGGLMLGFAILVDLIDYFVIGLIPILGDVVDLLAGAVIWLWVKMKGLDRNRSLLLSWSPWISSAIELIPFIGDLLPTFTLDVLGIIILNTSWGRRWAKILSPI